MTAAAKAKRKREREKNIIFLALALATSYYAVSLLKGAPYSCRDTCGHIYKYINIYLYIYIYISISQFWSLFRHPNVKTA